MQLDFNLKFENMQFGRETFEQMAHGSLSTNIPITSTNLMHLCLMLRNSR
jgi:hypothetical protein